MGHNLVNAEYLTLDETARYIGCSVAEVEGYIASWRKHSDGLSLGPPYTFPGGSVRVRLADVLRLKADKEPPAGPIHVMGSNGKSTGQHRVVMERLLGHPIPAGMVVHHIDGNKRNNHPDNLQLMTPSEHVRHHAKEKRYWKDSELAQLGTMPDNVLAKIIHRSARAIGKKRKELLATRALVEMRAPMA
jgi:hypothetical protein